ncbi:indole-3-glycerol phosphate synthase TrpC [Herbiconiux moechotypicola]|uniref:indole-3-glycerol phosphate synthase TrpC n=1 Tax=Herbiconiux moechotypicola TaxID=637393 RepID=UPI00217E673B|nr:indole-3-glycerol phosphate synthase TrpC [Herbiconiux moechotypicola]MCS5728640.1 indole-3-glycerol phosphate synthase TrpC [Herbiconiux moechotypicola]
MLAELMAGALDDASARESALDIAALEARALAQTPALDALAALAPAETVKVIAEVKRASPSRGELASIADPAALASLYASGGASAISVLTEGRRFKGSLADLEAVRSAVDVPVLRKDFIGTEYQVLEARASGADIVLLIVAALDQLTLERLHAFTTSLGMVALVETHDAVEVSRAVDIGARIVGVNARDLSTFELDADLFGRLSDRIPAGTIKVAESAVKHPADVAHYRASGADVVLIGEALVTGDDPVTTLKEFLSV